MQRVTNCILVDQQHHKVLLLKKPRRGWWVAPGGKMEKLETVTESVTREYREETGITLFDPVLRGVFTMVVEEDREVIDEWMMFTFLAHQGQGELLSESPEGELAWQDIDKIPQLSMAKGDHIFFDHILTKNELLVMKFRYTPKFELIAYE